MRNLMVLLCLVLAIPSMGWAQSKVTTKAQKQKSKLITLIPQIGTTYSTIRFKDRQGARVNPDFGFSVGANVLFNFGGSYLSGETGLFYTRNNYKQTFVNDNNTFSSQFDVVFQKFSIPLMLRVHPLTKSNGFFVKAGFVPNIQIGASGKGTYIDNTVTNGQVTAQEITTDKQHLSYHDGLRPITVDASAGLGYGLNVSKDYQMTAELSYQRGLIGLSNILEEDDFQMDSTTLLVGVIF